MRDEENIWDHLHNSIARLYNMLNETEQANRSIFTEQTRIALIKEFVEVDIDCGGITVEELLRGGHKGYENMTDLELCVEAQGQIAGWCGMSDNDSYSRPYETVQKEVNQACHDILCEEFEKHIT